MNPMTTRTPDLPAPLAILDVETDGLHPGRRITNSPANLLLVCGDATTPGGCHAWIETNRAEALRRGLLVRSTADPATVPVQLEGGDWVLLTHDGRRDTATAPKEDR